jgi:hypothetical protein
MVLLRERKSQLVGFIEPCLPSRPVDGSSTSTMCGRSRSVFKALCVRKFRSSLPLRPLDIFSPIFSPANLDGLIPHFSALIVVPNILNLSCEWAIIPEQFEMDALGALICEDFFFVVLDPSKHVSYNTFGS